MAAGGSKDTAVDVPLIRQNSMTENTARVTTKETRDAIVGDSGDAS